MKGEIQMEAFTLVGVDGNAYAIMGYTARAMKKAGLDKEVDHMYEEAKSGNYYNLIAVCDKYVNEANKALGLIDKED